MYTKNEDVNEIFILLGHQKKVHDSIPSSPLLKTLPVPSASPVGVNEFRGSTTNEETRPNDLSKSISEMCSYEDLLDKCSEQERLLGFDNAAQQEAEKGIQEHSGPAVSTSFSFPKVLNSFCHVSCFLFVFFDLNTANYF